MTGTKDALNAFLELPQVLVSPADSGPLADLSLAVKDIFDVAGYRTGCGNPQKFEESRIAEKTAPAVRMLLDSGARFAGKTQTDELAFSLIGQNAHFPQPVNPAAPDRVTGGSSSGSVAAVAGGLADIAVGSDTGGSIRAPASFCGLIGLRTTHGRIPMEGVMPLAPSFDTFGWFARDAETYAKAAEVLLGEDAPHPYPLPARGEREASMSAPPSPRLLRGEGKGEGQCRPFRLAALDTLALGPAEAAEYRRMVDIVSGVIGAPREASPLSFSTNELYWCFRTLQAYEAWAVHGAWISAKDRGLGPGVKERFEYGATITTEVMAAAAERRVAFRAAFTDLLGEDGLLVLPTVPGAAPLRNAPFDGLQAYRERALRLLCLAGLSGFPQITLPLGSINGAPFGISLLGPAGSDRQLVRLGREILETAGRS